MMYKRKTSLRRRMFALALVPAIGAGIAVTAIPSVAGVLESLAEKASGQLLHDTDQLPYQGRQERRC